MKITLSDNKILAAKKDDKTGKETEYVFNLGGKDIEEHGFQVVDHLVENIIVNLSPKEEVFVENVSNSSVLPARMLARKLEDKIKREVIIME